jgi:hypothetical protein
MAPDRMRLFMKRPFGDDANGERRPRIINGLRLALGAG